MTEEEKNKIIKRIEDDDYADIEQKKAEEFFASLSGEEKDYVSQKVSENMHKRHTKLILDREDKQWAAQRERIWAMRTLVNDFTGNRDYRAHIGQIKENIFNYMTEKEPFKVIFGDHYIEWYECPDCTTRLDKNQPFCSNCGRCIKWEED